MNRLAHALVRHRADPELLRMIAREADRLATRIELEPARERRMELVTHPHFDEAAEDGSLARLMPEGAFVDVFEDSPVSGSANPLSIGLRVAREGQEAVGRVVLGPGWQGAPDRAHGGVTAALLDETLGALLPILGVVAFTGELTCRYLAPTPIGEPLEFRARKVGQERRKLFLECEGTSEAGVFVAARSIFVTTDLEIFRNQSG